MVLAPNHLFSWSKNTVRHRTFWTGIHYVHYATYYTMCMTLTLCIISSWSREEVVFLVLSHLATSSLLPCLELTDAHCPFLGALGPLPPKWRPLSQDPRILPPHGSEHKGPTNNFTNKYFTFIFINLYICIHIYINF